jgi:hypothetical protein
MQIFFLQAMQKTFIPGNALICVTRNTRYLQSQYSRLTLLFFGSSISPEKLCVWHSVVYLPLAKSGRFATAWFETYITSKITQSENDM